jgi:inosine/xanthosine triphosphate pyrophosphatase family protein
MHRRITGKLVIATHNPGKLAEMRELLAPHGVEAVSAGELALSEPDETGKTFGANAKIKALAAAKSAQLPAFADDSGLVVDALDGAPGILSARWAGPNKDFMAAMTRIERLLRDREARISFPHCASPGPTIISRKSRPGSTERWYGRHAARPASATIRCSCPMDTPAPSAK